MKNEQRQLLHDLINHLNKNVLQSKEVSQYAQQFTLNDEMTVMLRAVKDTIDNKDYWQYVIEEIKNDESDDISKESESHQNPYADIRNISIFQLPCCSSNNLLDDESLCKSELSDIDIEFWKDKFFKEIVEFADTYQKYDFHALQYIRQLLLHMNREKEADEVENLIKQLITKNYNIGGNYIEKQVNNYGKGK